MKPEARLILVAQNTGADIFLSLGRKLKKIKSFSHPEGRLKDSEIGADRPGRTKDRKGKAKHSYSFDHPLRGSGLENFAREIDLYLTQERQGNGLDKLVIIAAPQFLGVLRENLESSNQRLIEKSIPMNLAHFNDREKEEKLLSLLE